MLILLSLRSPLKMRWYISINVDTVNLNTVVTECKRNLTNCVSGQNVSGYKCEFAVGYANWGTVPT